MGRIDLVRKPDMKRIVLWGLAALLAATSTQAQLSTRDLGENISPQDMVSALLGGGVSASNIQYTGATNASGVFCGGDGIIGFNTGILLTSGDAANVIGPNNSPAKSTDNGLGGDLDLDSLIGATNTFDASVLTFDFIPDSDTVQFNYVFGSEEYNEFVGSPFNDVFGFFVNGVNYALLPGTSLPVAITNVNNGFSPGISAGPCKNCQFYIDNVDAHLNTQLDGITTVLTFTAPVLRNQVNHMKIAIADVADHALDSAVFIQSGSLRSGTSFNATRTSRYWFTHALSSDPTCATLSNAIAKIMASNCGVVPLGFLDLPQGFRNSDNVKDSADATIEALGFYYRSTKRTGETGGTQNQKSPASTVCTDRKKLCVELIAALANVDYLGATPSALSYINAKTNTTFPSDLITQAETVAAGEDTTAIVSMTALLKKFNSSGLTNDFPTDVVECSTTKSSLLKSLSRDATTQATCPGVNNSCASAQQVVFSSSAGSFSSAVFTKSVNLSAFTNSFPSPVCGAGGRDVVWAITPKVGSNGRQFTVSTKGSNFDTMLSIWSGTCSNLTAVTCTNGALGVTGEVLSFRTDGTNTFYIVGEGPNGQYGNLKIKITSP